MRVTPRLIAYSTLLVYWAPSNALWYLWGFILFLFIVLAKPEWTKIQGRISKLILRAVLLFVIVFAISAAVNFKKHDSHLNNLVWSVITYGSSLCLLLAFLTLPFKAEDAWPIFKFSLYLSIIQVFVGYVQMLSYQSFTSLNPFSVGGGGVGDTFVGTTFDEGIGNHVAAKLALTALLFIPFWFNKRNLKSTVFLLILCVGWILASAIYTLLIGFLVVLYYFVYKKLLQSFTTSRLSKTVFYASIIGVIAVVSFISIQPENISYLTQTLKQAYFTFKEDELHSTGRKVAYYRRTLTKLPEEYPSALVVGTGPGNYSSRSAWLVSGEYLVHQPWYIPVTPTPLAKKYNISIWSSKMITRDYVDAGSIANQPFSTWLSVFAETGLIGLFAFATIFYALHRAFKRSQPNKTPDLQSLQTGLRMSLLFITLLFFVDNLFEWPLVMGQFFVFACLYLKISEQNPAFSDPISYRQISANVK